MYLSYIEFDRWKCLILFSKLSIFAKFGIYIWQRATASRGNIFTHSTQHTTLPYMLHPLKQIYLYNEFILLTISIFNHALLIRENWFYPCFSALVQTRCQTFSKFQLSIPNKKLTRGWDTGYLNINCWKMDKNSSDWLMGNVLTEASQLFTLGFLWFTEHMFDILLNCFHLKTPRSH